MDKVKGGFKPGYEIHRDFSSKVESAIEAKKSFNVFGFKIGRPEFMQDKKGIERIQRSQQMADEILRDMMNALEKSFQQAR